MANKLIYQPGSVNVSYHRYDYDAENRLTDVYTTTRKAYIGHTNLEEHEAHYQYYKHGPLARTIIGQNQVQGIDYAYTLQGWLKGVNSTAVGDGVHDMGSDGTLTARDAYGFSLNYFNGDYQPIGTAAPFAPVSIGNNLYNGNIKAMAVNIPTLGDARVYKYGYDQLNRLVAMDAYGGLNNSANTFSPVLLDDYKEQITYDPNGNILTYKRNGDAVRLTMDNLTYSYKPNTNKLDKVTDAAPDVASGEYDKYNDIKQGQQDGNYQYDAVGNLISDVSEGITNIEWTVYGKIKSITKTGGVNISYSYDAAGNRISKNVNGKETWYVRDASGNVMSVYSKEPTQHSGHLMQSEVHLYGSARLGILNTDKDMELSPVGVSVVTFETGYRHYELTNHLGNVLATVSDRKLSHSTDGTYIDYYTADVVSANDYYPAGMLMPGRKFSTERFRYGFNGKELDKEVAGTTTYDYGFRIYNPGLGRFLSVDPLTKEYPWNSTYAFAENEPIANIDLDGLEKFRVTIRTFLPYTYVWEPHSREIIDKANTRWYPQYRNVEAHGGFKSQQVFDIDFDARAITKYHSIIPPTLSKNLSSRKLQKFDNASTKTDQFTTLYENIAHIYTELSTSNPSPWYMTPPIKYNLNITVGDNGIWQIKGNWGGFPALEVFMEDLESGQTDLLEFQKPIDAGKDLRTGDNPKEIMNLFPIWGDKKIDKIGQLGDRPQNDKDAPSPKVKENNIRFSGLDCNCDPPVRNHTGN